MPALTSKGRRPGGDGRVEGPPVERGGEVLTPAALEFVPDLQTRFGTHRDALLAARATRRAEIAAARRIDVAGIGKLERLHDAPRLFGQGPPAREVSHLLTPPADELRDPPRKAGNRLPG